MHTESLLTFWSILIISLHFLQASNGNASCTLSCGIIPNITSPFRNCGKPKYELACENNVTSIYIGPQKSLVKAINYSNSTIRLVDASMSNDICSFPKYSAYAQNFSDEYPFSTHKYMFRDENDPGVAWPINFLSCPYQLDNSLHLIEVSDCANGSNSFGASNLSDGRFTYIKVGQMNASDVRNKCSVNLIVMTSWKFKDFENVSLSKIHDALMYGFEPSWFHFRCIKCKGGMSCTSIEERLDGCPEDSFRFKLDLKWGQSTMFLLSVLFWVILLLLIIIGARLEILIISGFICVWGFLIISNLDWFTNSVKGVFVKLLLIVVVSYAAKIVISFPCVMGILTYNFRRRHLSMFNDIEVFLQSDNNLSPIRYSYSELKKMTRGFREKLGEGGYGSVYKGKTRSGHDVAVKLLGKAGGKWPRILQ